MKRRIRWILPLVVATAAAASLAASHAGATPKSDGATATPIKHLVVIFQENVSFDHYFGTYPTAANTDGQPFVAGPGTPAVDGLKPATDPSIPASLQHATDLTATNPNASLPSRLDSSPNGPGANGNGVLTCDQDHNYMDEQQAFDGGAMDQFVQSVGTDAGTHIPLFFSDPTAVLCNPRTDMNYYDGNVVTGLWNYAQRYAMDDNSFGNTFGPSAPGAINLASGDTGGIDTGHLANNPPVESSTAPSGFSDLDPDGLGGFSLIGDAQPYWDDCSTRDAVAFTGKNIGDELNAAGISWGWFQGGFRPTTTFAAAAAGVGRPGQPTETFIPDEFAGSFPGKNVPPHASNQALCDAVSPVGEAFGATPTNAPWGYKDDYIQHHEPFQYYASTANPHHLSVPTDASGNDTLAGLATIGRDTQSYVGSTPQFDTPNHNYDTSDFDQLVAAIAAHELPQTALPAVSFLKAPGIEDGHAAYSDPLDEQRFIANVVNELEQTPDWSSTAVIVNYDDSDGWYDHVFSGVLNPSASPADNLTPSTLGPISPTNPTSQKCGSETTTKPLSDEQGRCGLGPRLPMLVISPWAKTDYVDHDLTDQASIINFVEYNWGLPAIPGSFDQALASVDKAVHHRYDLEGLFDFKRGNENGLPAVQLDPTTGQVDIRGQRLNNDTLDKVNLSNAEAQGAKIQSSSLRRAFLEGINLSGATLRDSNLSGADLRGANLTSATLDNADLERVDFTNANLTGASLKGANIHGAIWSHTTCPDGTSSDADGGTCANNLR